MVTDTDCSLTVDNISIEISIETLKARVVRSGGSSKRMLNFILKLSSDKIKVGQPAIYATLSLPIKIRISQ